MSDFDPHDVVVGDVLLVRDASGNEITMRAISGLYRGANFPCVRVCEPEDYPDDEDGIPWPAEAVLGRVSSGGAFRG